jgi:hypothetical protein
MTEENKQNKPVNPTLFKPGNQLAKGHGFGRPIEWTEDRLLKEAEALDQWLDDPNVFYIGEFCESRGYTLQTLDDLTKKSAVLSETVRKAKQAQENRIVSSSLKRKFDGNFAKFVLANRAGWKEKTEVSGDAANPLSFLLGNIDGKSKDIIDISDNQLPDKS